jgi:hypothetical protein
MHFQLKHPRATYEMLGYLPDFWLESDPRSAKEQANTSYAHGGGWNTIESSVTSKFVMEENGLRYPGDPLIELLAEGRLHDKETIRIYNHAFVAIVQDDGTYEICRMD